MAKKAAKKKKGSGHSTSKSAMEDFRQQFCSLEDHMRFVQKELEELQTLSSKLLDVGVAISSEINLYSLLTRIIEEAKNLIKAQNGTLYLTDRKTNELYFHVVDVEQLKEVRIPIDHKSISGYVAQSGAILNIEDVYKISRSNPYSFNKAIDQKTGLRTKSMLTVPMLNHEGDITGAVQLINKVDDGKVVPFSKRDERILMSLASQAAVAIENAHLYKELAELFEAIVQFSASAIDERDPATAGHSRRVAMYAVATARAMKNFTPEELRELEYAAWLHDVGKIGVREHILNKENKLYPEELGKVRERFDAIKLSARLQASEKIMALANSKTPEKKIAAISEKLEKTIAEIDADLKIIEKHNKPGFMGDKDKKDIMRIAKKTYLDSNGVKRNFLTKRESDALKVFPGNLTTQEKEIMNAHVISSYNVLRRIPFSQRLKNVPIIAASHHERNDGSGYPDGLKKNDIPIQGRILAIVDVFDALTAQDRPYKPAMPIEKALSILKAEVEAGRMDRDIFAAFLKSKVYELKDPGK